MILRNDKFQKVKTQRRTKPRLKVMPEDVSNFSLVGELREGPVPLVEVLRAESSVQDDVEGTLVSRRVNPLVVQNQGFRPAKEKAH